MKKFLKSGIFWTVVIGVLGIIITIMIYKWSNKEREPVYSIKNPPSVIFDNENSSPNFRLITSDSTVVSRNVYLASVVIWNEGDLEIKPSDVRKDFVISISGDSEILDYKIVGETHPGLAQFSLTQLGNDLKLDWTYFDPGFGIEVQVIYTGDKCNCDVPTVEGYVLGSEVKKVDTGRTTSYIIIFIISLIVYVITTVFIYKFRVLNPNEKKEGGGYNKVKILIWVSIIMAFGMSVWNLLRILFSKIIGVYELPL